MRLRPPSVPLITVDPYFSVWSAANALTNNDTVHWTGKPNTMRGTVTVDGEAYRFMGTGSLPHMKQTYLDVNAMTTEYRFTAGGIELTARFTSPLFLDDYYYLTRPVSYLKLTYRSLDKKEHSVVANIAVSEEICLNFRGQDAIDIEMLEQDGISTAKIGSVSQPVLAKRGDDIRIDWGYFYLSTDTENAKIGAYAEEVPFAKEHHDREFPHGESKEMTFVFAENTLDPETGALFTFAYDDIESMIYFGEHLKTYWNKDGALILDEITKAFSDYEFCYLKSEAFSDRLFIDATKAGGEKYAELLMLAYRQVLAAHKLVLDTDGSILYISKECHSNGCAATVDVSYPSIPMFLLYNPELVRGMMRPIVKYSRSDEWAKTLKFDFAPHDAGQYPHVNGQVYADNNIDGQMPVEECGNMLVMAATEAIASGDISYAKENLDLFEAWVKYLEKHGRDPENQLCTDDFAGHLAHNCNLSLKAIMGIAGLGIIYKMLGNDEKYACYLKKAREMATDWAVRAANGDGSYRLAFDREGSFSMKYNIVWDKLFGTEIMAKSVIASEVASYRRKTNKYGLPLDNRATYTKSDWLVWTATLAEDRDDFEEMVAPLWNAYHYSMSRCPMTDWYDTVSSRQIGFRHRTVQGGLWIKLLDASGKMKLEF